MKRALCALLLAALLFSCAPAQALTKEDLISDYDQLWAILEESYPFFPVLKKRGIDPQAIRQENREALLREVDDDGEFAALVRNTFSRLGNLAHLQVVSAEAYDSYYGQFEWPQATRDFYAAFDRGEAQTFAYPQAEASWLPAYKAVLFRFPTFGDPAALEGDQNLVADFMREHPDAEHILFDITGNTGGNANYWIQNIVSPFGGAYVWERDNYFLASPVTQDVLAQYPCEEALGEGHPAFVQEMGFTHLLRTRDVYPPEGTKASVSSEAKRWVLIDGAVFSAADGFAAFCKATGWATLVGKRTMGDGADAFSPQAVALEKTGLLVRFSVASCANPDGSINAEKGTLPDVICKPGELPYWACLRAIGRMER